MSPETPEHEVYIVDLWAEGKEPLDEAYIAKHVNFDEKNWLAKLTKTLGWDLKPWPGDWPSHHRVYWTPWAKDRKVEPYRVMPPPTEEEYESRKESVRARGEIWDTVWMDEDKNIIDGHTNYRIWQELDREGVKLRPLRVEYTAPGMTDVEKRTLAREKNCQRRHLTTEQKQQIIRDQLLDTPELSNNEIARICGVSDKTVAKQRAILEQGSEIPNLGTRTGPDGKKYPAKQVSRVASFGPQEGKRALAVLEKLTDKDLPVGAIRVDKAESILRKKQWAEKEAHEPDPTFSVKNIDLRTGDCEKVLANVPDGSVDMILTDPPWNKEGVFTLKAFQKLGRLAARLLKPDGLAVVYAGNLYLPQEIMDMEEHLEYLWTLTLIFHGQRPRVPLVNVRNGWRVVTVWRRKGSKRGLDMIEDVIDTKTPPEKEDGEWQQKTDEAAKLIQQLTKPGELVCDPFVGFGSFAVAAYKERRRFVGAEIIPGRVRITQNKLEKAAKEMSAKP